MQIRTMSPDDLDMVVGWAREEGWNPGLDDAAAFFAADPKGFFLGTVGSTPAAAISVVNHDDAQAFLGLYIARPPFRGQGHGLALWTHALHHAGARTVGLEGVPAQQANYRASGFEWYGKTVRCAGPAPVGRGRCRIAGPEDLAALIERDAAAIGYSRAAFATAWFAPQPTRRTVLLEDASGLRGFATVRQCHEGVKVGPLQAETEANVLDLLASGSEAFDAEPVFVDAPYGSALHRLLNRLGYVPVFETAKMIRGTPPLAAPPAYSSVATLELG